jgi:hypothetical protein
MSKSHHEDRPVSRYRFISSKSPDYRREFINGALSNVTPRGEIVCDFHFESKDLPTEQIAIRIEDDKGKAKLSDLQDTGTFTRDVKFGIVINVPFAKDLIIMLNKKILEAEEVIAERATPGVTE